MEMRIRRQAKHVAVAPDGLVVDLPEIGDDEDEEDVQVCLAPNADVLKCPRAQGRGAMSVRAIRSETRLSLTSSGVTSTLCIPMTLRASSPCFTSSWVRACGWVSKWIASVPPVPPGDFEFRSAMLSFSFLDQQRKYWILSGSLCDFKGQAVLGGGAREV